MVRNKHFIFLLDVSFFNMHFQLDLIIRVIKNAGEMIFLKNQRNSSVIKLDKYSMFFTIDQVKLGLKIFSLLQHFWYFLV